MKYMLLFSGLKMLFLFVIFYKLFVIFCLLFAYILLFFGKNYLENLQSQTINKKVRFVIGV